MPDTDATYRCQNSGCFNRTLNPDEACVDCMLAEARPVVTAARILDALGYSPVSSFISSYLYDRDLKVVADILRETYE